MGVLTPKPVEIAELSAGEVGFFVANHQERGRHQDRRHRHGR